MCLLSSVHRAFLLHKNGHPYISRPCGWNEGDIPQVYDADAANISLYVHSLSVYLLVKYLALLLMDPASTQTNHYIYIKMCAEIDLYYSECNACLDGERVNGI